MKTLLIYFTVFLCINSCTTSKQKDSNKQEKTNLTAQTTKEQKQSVSMQQDSVSLSLTTTKFKLTDLEEPVDLKITNNTDVTLHVPAYYTIEYYSNSEWITLPFSTQLLFEEIIYSLLPNKSITPLFHFHTDKYNYTKGKYRIKKYYYEKSSEQRQIERQCYAEFTIE